MKVTIHDWVLNVIAAPNPTQYTKLDKYTVKPKSRNWPEILVYIQCRVSVFIFNWVFVFVCCEASPKLRERELRQTPPLRQARCRALRAKLG